MPRSVRNFWLELSVDGRKSEINTGPRHRDGGFYLNILIREKGDVSFNGVSLEGYYDDRTDQNVIIMRRYFEGNNDIEQELIRLPR